MKVLVHTTRRYINGYTSLHRMVITTGHLIDVGPTKIGVLHEHKLKVVFEMYKIYKVFYHI